jgi:hypothetical protein
MGGIGPGRYGGKRTIGGTRSYTLRVGPLRDFLRPGRPGFRMTFGSDRDEVVVTGMVEVEGSAPHIRVSHTTRREPREEITYTIPLASTQPYLGGTRWWFLCPQRHRRAAKLYLPQGGRYFLSREAHGLVHDTRQMCTADRQSRRIDRIAARLGSPNHDFMNPPAKPPRMRRRVYDRLVERWYQARNTYWGTLNARLGTYVDTLIKRLDLPKSI